MLSRIWIRYPEDDNSATTEITGSSSASFGGSIVQTASTTISGSATSSFVSEEISTENFFEYNFGSDILDEASPFEVFKDNGGAISPYVFTVQEDVTAIGEDCTKISATANSTNVRWVAKLKESVLPQAADQEILVRAKILINGNGALEIQFRSQYDDITDEYTGYRLKLNTLGGASDPLDADTLEVRLRRLRGTGTEDTISGGGGSISQEYAEWFWVRAQAEGTDIRCKVWNSDDPEPGSWTFDITDTNMLNDGPVTDPGFIMFVGFHPVAYSAFTYPDLATLDYFATETNSANWPIPLPGEGGPVEGDFDLSGAGATSLDGSIVYTTDYQVEGDATPLFTSNIVKQTDFTVEGSATSSFEGSQSIDSEYTIVGEATSAFASQVVRIGDFDLESDAVGDFVGAQQLSTDFAITAAASVNLDGQQVQETDLTIEGSSDTSFAGQRLAQTDYAIEGIATPSLISEVVYTASFSLEGDGVTSFLTDSGDIASFAISATTDSSIAGNIVGQADYSILGDSDASYVGAIAVSSSFNLDGESQFSPIGSAYQETNYSLAGESVASFTSEVVVTGSFALTGQTTSAFSSDSSLTSSFTLTGQTSLDFEGEVDYTASFTSAGVATVDLAGAIVNVTDFAIEGDSASSFSSEPSNYATATFSLVGVSSVEPEIKKVIPTSASLSGQTTVSLEGKQVVQGIFSVTGSGTSVFISASPAATNFNISATAVAQFRRPIEKTSDIRTYLALPEVRIHVAEAENREYSVAADSRSHLTSIRN